MMADPSSAAAVTTAQPLLAQGRVIAPVSSEQSRAVRKLECDWRPGLDLHANEIEDDGLA
eukprot:1305287-Rhodomonas_salina.2